MKKSILEIYALAVCFVTVVCAVVALGIGIYDIVEMSNPEFTLAAYQFERHQTNEAFFSRECDEQISDQTEEQKTQQRLASYDRALKTESRNAVQSLVKIVIVLVIDICVFLIHWRIARYGRESAST